MSHSQDNSPFFLRQNTGFGRIVPEDDLLHPDSFRNNLDPAAMESQYFGFSVPEAHIHALTYMWHHPNLKICSGGLFVFRGIKQTMVHAELADWRTFMHEDLITRNNLHEYRLDNGYGVKILEPLSRFHMTYADPDRGNNVDLEFEALLPAVMFSDGCHFEQTMRVRGALQLRGTQYPVDCFTIRDRTWSKTRPETLIRMPPLSWMVGTFASDFSFNCSVYDQALGNPFTPDEFALEDAAALSSGWVYRDGKLGRIISARKRVSRSRGSTVANAVELQFIDEHQRRFDLRGSLLASCPFTPWNNVWSVINLMRWECDDQIGHGDHQEVFWNDYLNAVRDSLV